LCARERHSGRERRIGKEGLGFGVIIGLWQIAIGSILIDNLRKNRTKNANEIIKGKFYLRVYDNYHYMDESKAYNHGQYETYKDAIVGAKVIVDEFIEHYWKPGVKPAEFLAGFAAYGEEPIILPNEHGELENFSARTYFKSRIAEICHRHEINKWKHLNKNL